MGGGSFDSMSFAKYSVDNGRAYDYDTNRASGQVFHQHFLDPKMDPKGVMRECVNSEEHPNTIPVILALDVTGSMGRACKETAEALGVIMTDLYSKFKDIEFMIMGIGDLAYDEAPVQASQFESDIRIAESVDKVFMEHGGGGNSYESYTAAWYMGLHHCKLDCWEQGRKGIIITMGDESLNPYLPKEPTAQVFGDNLQSHINTPALYEEVIKKFDVFHISINDPHCSYQYHEKQIKDTFNPLLGQRAMVSTINDLSKTICACIESSVNTTEDEVIEEKPATDENGDITW